MAMRFSGWGSVQVRTRDSTAPLGSFQGWVCAHAGAVRESARSIARRWVRVTCDMVASCEDRTVGMDAEGIDPVRELFRGPPTSDARQRGAAFKKGGGKGSKIGSRNASIDEIGEAIRGR